MVLTLQSVSNHLLSSLQFVLRFLSAQSSCHLFHPYVSLVLIFSPIRWWGMTTWAHFAFNWFIDEFSLHYLLGNSVRAGWLWKFFYIVWSTNRNHQLRAVVSAWPQVQQLTIILVDLVIFFHSGHNLNASLHVKNRSLLCKTNIGHNQIHSDPKSSVGYRLEDSFYMLHKLHGQLNWKCIWLHFT